MIHVLPLMSLRLAVPFATCGLVLSLGSIKPALGATKLNESVVGRVTDFQISNDGKRVVFVTRSSDGYRVFSRDLAGLSSPVLLNDGVIRDYYGAIGISPDSQWAIMRLHDGTPFNSQDVFSRRIDGSGPLTNLTGELTAVNFASASATFQITSDSNQIVIHAIQNGVAGVYAGPIDGSTILGLIGRPPPPRTDIESFSLAADGKVVVQSFGAFSVPIDGSSSAIELSGGLRVQQLKLTPDGSRIVFRSQQSYQDPWIFYAAPVDGSGPLVALGGPTSNSSDINRRWQITPDGSQFVSISDEDNQDQFELYTRNIDGSGPSQKLNMPLLPDDDVASFLLSPDSQWIIYSQTNGGVQNGRRFLTRIDGTVPAVELQFPAPEGYHLGSATFAPPVSFSPDSQSLLYTVFRTEPSPQGGQRYYSLLFSRPLDGSTPETLLSTNVNPNESVADYSVTPDSKYVVFGKDPDGALFDINTLDLARNHELFAVPIGGGALQLLGDPLPNEQVISVFSFTPDGKSVVFQSNVAPGQVDLYVAPLPIPETSSAGLMAIASLCFTLHQRVSRVHSR